MSKPVDSEDIIRSVKKYKAIWDLEDEGYHNKNLKDDAWNDVCLELISDWKILGSGDKYIRQLELKKKWNNIRDYYKKLLADKRQGEQVRAKKRRYLYSDILEFIRPVYDKKQNELEQTNNCNDSNASTHFANEASDGHEQDSENDTHEDMETVTFIGIPPKTPAPKQPNPVTRTKPQQRITRPASKMKKSTLSVFERSLIKSLEKRSSTDEDSDLLFLKSLLPDMKSLTPSQKFDFKLGIMELYRNIVNASSEQQDINRDDYDLDRLSEAQVKVETVRLSVDEEFYESS